MSHPCRRRSNGSGRPPSASAPVDGHFSSTPTWTACPGWSRSASPPRRWTEAHLVFVSHAHFDHLAGADVIASSTGATVVASPESARCLRACGVPEDQLLVVTGGETVDRAPSVRVRYCPRRTRASSHTAIPTARSPAWGDLGISAESRAMAVGPCSTSWRVPEPAGGALRAMNDRRSRDDGGQLAFLLSTAEGSVLVKREPRATGAASSVGCAPMSHCCRWADGRTWTASPTRDRPENALEQVQLLQPASVAFCHHDPLFPGVPGVDIGPAVSALRGLTSGADYFELEYATACRRSPEPLRSIGPDCASAPPRGRRAHRSGRCATIDDDVERAINVGSNKSRRSTSLSRRRCSHT